MSSSTLTRPATTASQAATQVANQIELLGHFPHVGAGACIVANTGLSSSGKDAIVAALVERLGLPVSSRLASYDAVYAWNDSTPTETVVATLRAIAAEA